MSGICKGRMGRLSRCNFVFLWSSLRDSLGLGWLLFIDLLDGDSVIIIVLLAVLGYIRVTPKTRLQQLLVMLARAHTFIGFCFLVLVRMAALGKGLLIGRVIVFDRPELDGLDYT